MKVLMKALKLVAVYWLTAPVALSTCLMRHAPKSVNRSNVNRSVNGSVNGSVEFVLKFLLNVYFSFIKSNDGSVLTYCP